jgi:hypothetical protein
LRNFIYVVATVTRLVGLFGAPAYASVPDVPTPSQVLTPKDPFQDASPQGNAPVGGGVNENSGPGPYVPSEDVVQPPAAPYDIPAPPVFVPQPEPVAPNSKNPEESYVDPSGFQSDEGYNYGDGDVLYYVFANPDSAFEILARWYIIIMFVAIALLVQTIIMKPRMDEEDIEFDDEPKKQIRPQDDPSFDPDAPREFEPHPDYGTPPVRL